MVGGLMNHAFGISCIYKNIPRHHFSMQANNSLVLGFCVAMILPFSRYFQLFRFQIFLKWKFTGRSHMKLAFRRSGYGLPAFTSIFPLLAFYCACFKQNSKVANSQGRNFNEKKCCAFKHFSLFFFCLLRKIYAKALKSS